MAYKHSKEIKFIVQKVQEILSVDQNTEHIESLEASFFFNESCATRVGVERGVVSVLFFDLVTAGLSIGLFAFKNLATSFSISRRSFTFSASSDSLYSSSSIACVYFFTSLRNFE